MLEDLGLLGLRMKTKIKQNKNNLLSHPYHLVPQANNSDDNGGSDGNNDNNKCGDGDYDGGDGDDDGHGGDSEVPITFLKTLHI